MFEEVAQIGQPPKKSCDYHGVVSEWDWESLEALPEALGVLDLASSYDAVCWLDAWTKTWLTTEPYLRLLTKIEFPIIRISARFVPFEISDHLSFISINSASRSSLDM